MKLADLYVKLGLKNKQFNQGLNKSQKKASGFGNAMKKVGGMVAGAFAFTQVIQGIKKFISVNAEFGQSIANLSAITGATGKDLEFYREQAIALGKASTLSASDVAKGFELMGSANPDLLKSKEAITLAEASGLDLPTATQALSKALNQFNLPASEAGKAINVLAAGSKAGAEAIPGIADAIKVMGTAANMAGISLEQSVGAVETLAEKGISGAESGTQLRNVILKLQSEADEFNPKVVGLSKALENLGKENLSAAELTKMFGLRNQQAAAILIQNRDKLESYTKAVTGTSVAYEQQKKKTDTLMGSWKALGSAVEGVVLGFKGTNGFLKGIVDQVTKWVNDIGTFFKNLQTTIAKNKTITEFLGKIKDLFKNLVEKQFKRVAAVFKAVINLVVAVANAIIKAYNESEDFRLVVAGIKTAFQALWKVGEALFQSLMGGFKTLTEWIKSGFKGDVWSDFWSDTKKVWADAVKEIGSDAQKNMKDAIEAEPIQPIIIPKFESGGGGGAAKAPDDQTTTQTERFEQSGLMTGITANADLGADFGLADMSGITDRIAAETNLLQEELNRQQEVFDNFNSNMKAAITDFAQNTVTDFASSLGEMVAAGNVNPGELGTQLLASIGGLIGTLGKMLITLGLGSEAFQKLLGSGLTNPVSAGLAIAAGAALVAIGAGIQKTAKNAAGSGAGGGVSSPTGDFSNARPSEREAAAAQEININLEGILRGNDIQLSNERTDYRQNAIG